ncbi:MAG: hypothetical protein EXQ83_13895 [Xanthobacteraceae bacterium]|nr:hypothetical protein [Xanthobacteraceae bacterium]
MTVFLLRVGNSRHDLLGFRKALVGCAAAQIAIAGQILIQPSSQEDRDLLLIARVLLLAIPRIVATARDILAGILQMTPELG